MNKDKMPMIIVSVLLGVGLTLALCGLACGVATLVGFTWVKLVTTFILLGTGLVSLFIGLGINEEENVF